ncbi:hypothetical protein CO046_05030 [Candidatus Peregrinibacteria bacterium CG_4_9_14_0_2_um_filter_53_11]|nr:MAG: hypothetical protein CO046_05030 [Candidatus Peregrinibacteria bacterium CG_4_9_14_0_2_um_filter_53_11]
MITLATESLKGYGLSRIFRFVKEAGFDGVDLYIDPRDFDSQNATYVKGLVDEFQLPVVSIHTAADASQSDVLHSIEMAKELETKIIVVQPPKMFNFKYIKWLTKEVPKIRQKEDISIALENGSEKTLLGLIPENALNNINELRKFKHAALDTTRVALKHEDLIRTFHLIKKFLVHVHLSNLRKGEGYALPNEGILPLESFLTKLKQEGYKGAISYKISPKSMGAGSDDKVMKNLKLCKEFYEEYFVSIPAGEQESEEELEDFVG